MMRSSFAIGAIALVFGLAACSDAEEAVQETPAPVVENPDGGDGSEGDAGMPPMDSVEYFVEVVGDRVFFEFDKSDLAADGQETLFSQAEWLGQNADASIVIEGHCDERGTREYNLALGERRADAVKAFLVGAGVDESRIQTVSYGKERPVAVCSDESCWSQNRRGVTMVSGMPAS